MFFHGCHELLGRDIGAQVDYGEVSALQHHTHQVLANVVQIPSNGPDHGGSGLHCSGLGQQRLEDIQGHLHGARRDQHVGDIVFAVFHAPADFFHPGHQGLL